MYQQWIEWWDNHPWMYAVAIGAAILVVIIIRIRERNK